MSQQCENCAALTQIIQRQEQRITCLQSALELANRVISTAGYTCADISGEADRELNRGSVPRGRWSYLKGQSDAAERVRGTLHLVNGNC